MIRLGTRGSALALTQARLAAAALGGDVEIVPLVTAGDRDRALPDKEKWVRELDRALLAGEIDLAVHSAKDVPGRLADGVALVAALPREDPRDALVGAAGLAELPHGARVGTSSLRRAGQLRALRPDLRVEPLRGNIDTRLAIVERGEFAAAVLAQAGLNRLGRGAAGAPLEQLVPAPGQGIVAITARVGDSASAAAAMSVNDPAAFTVLRAERAVSAGVGADCSSAIGIHAELAGDTRLTLRALVTVPDGTRALRDEQEGGIEAPELLGDALARRLLAAGAADLLHGAGA